MKRFVFLVVFSLVAGFAAAQMISDDDVIEILKTEQGKGKSQQEIATELVKKGVTVEQLKRIKAKVEKEKDTYFTKNVDEEEAIDRSREEGQTKTDAKKMGKELHSMLEPKPEETDEIVINLNGFTITGGDEYTGVNQTGADISAITVDEDATLTIQGVGKVIGGTYAINAVKGTVNISGGNFFAPYTAVQLRAATLNITGGRFEVTELQSGMYYVINCVDSNWNNGTAILNITGGSFKNFDPANAWESLHRVSFVPEGYTTNLVDDMYFVVPVSE